MDVEYLGVFCRMFNFLKYAALFIAGTLILFLCSKFHTDSQPHVGEYYYSEFLRNGYTILAGVLLFVSGLLTGYFLKLNPWLSGLSMILIFPLATLYEGTVYRGSHNLLPFEFIIFFLFALPVIVGVYIGKYVSKRYSKIVA